MDHITSRHNPTILAMRALAEKKTREQQRMLLVEGWKMAGEAFASGLPVTHVLVDETQAERRASALARVPEGARVYAVPAHVIEFVCDTRTPQGIAVAVGMPPQLALNPPPSPLVALDGVQDPGNLGTIWRTAEAAGFAGLLLSGACADAFSPKVARGTMGALFRLPVLRTAALADDLAALAARGYHIVCADLEGTPAFARGPLPGPLVLVVGGESGGVTPDVLRTATARLTLPMRGGESLNASVAAGILMYDLLRERMMGGN